MAKKIIVLPGRISRGLLRLVGTVIAFLFTWFVYASGQIITAAGRSATVSKMQSIIPAYGVMEKEMAPARFSVKGTVKSGYGYSPVPYAIITLQDTTTKQIIDSTITGMDGSFFMTVTQPGLIPNTWLLEVRNTYYFNKDTLISIPAGDTAEVKIIVDWSLPIYGCPPPSAKSGILNMSAQARAADGAIGVSYSLPVQGKTRLELYYANGGLAKEIFTRYESAGRHEIRVKTSELSAGTYFLKLQSGAQAAITKISVRQ
jgi:hypothetical protein